MCENECFLIFMKSYKVLLEDHKFYLFFNFKEVKKE